MFHPPIVRLRPVLLLAIVVAWSAGPTPAEAANEAAETVALAAGSELRMLASTTSPVVVEIGEDTHAVVLDRHGDWLRLQAGDSSGWWDGAAPSGGEATATAGPWIPDAQAVAALSAARAQLGDTARWRLLGPFRLVTDVSDEELLASLQTLATEVTALYGKRYGLPVPEAAARPPAGSDSPAVAFAEAGAGTVILFADPGDYRAFAGNHLLAGHSVGRLAALPLDSVQSRLRRLLAHELVHLLNRHAFPGHLPAWLDEGLAGDLELVPSRPDGTLRPGPLGLGALRVAGHGQHYGPLIALERLLPDARRGHLEALPDLEALDPSALLESPRRGDLYALTALWVRFLLDDRASAGRARSATFHDHLARVATSPTPVPLSPALSDPKMAVAFRRWLVDLARRIPSEGHRIPGLAEGSSSCPYC